MQFNLEEKDSPNILKDDFSFKNVCNQQANSCLSLQRLVGQIQVQKLNLVVATNQMPDQI